MLLRAFDPRWRRRARVRLRRRLARLSARDVVRAIWLGVLIGVVTGVGAILLFETLELTTRYVLTQFTGLVPPTPDGEGAVDAQEATRLWALPLVAGGAGLVAGIVIFWLAPEASGGGSDQIIDDFHNHGGRVRGRMIPVKLAATAITIGGGGAAGREGPAAQISGGLGSVLGERLGLDAVERRRALVAGMGAGVGAIFRAPLGGAMLAAESLYRDDFEADAILLSLISSIVAFTVYGVYYDFNPMFGDTAGFSFTHPQELPYYLGLGIACGILGLIYSRGLGLTQRFFAWLTGPRWAKPAIGGVLVGVIAMFAPEAIHVGYGWVQRSLQPEDVMDYSLWLIAALPLLRIITALLTVGSGGSGGVFAPGMVSGGLTGALFWRLFQDLPGCPAEPAPLVIIGMIATLGGVTHAPLAMLLMVGEMTGNLSLLAPAMVAVAVSTLIVGKTTIYSHQVATRAQSQAHRYEFAFPLLAALPVERALMHLPLVPDTATVAEALSALDRAQRTEGLVVDEENKLIGEISRERLRAASDASEPVEPLVEDIPVVVHIDTTLDEVLERLGAYGRQWLPVLDVGDGPVLGAIDARTVMRTYRRAEEQQVRPLTPVDEEISTIELTVARGSPLEGQTLAQGGLPPGVRILTLERMGRTSVPAGDTRIHGGDRLTLAMPRAARAQVLSLILGD